MASQQRPTWLDLAHKKLDAAVFAAYGWASDLTDEEILEQQLLDTERRLDELRRERDRELNERKSPDAPKGPKKSADGEKPRKKSKGEKKPRNEA